MAFGTVCLLRSARPGSVTEITAPACRLDFLGGAPKIPPMLPSTLALLLSFLSAEPAPAPLAAADKVKLDIGVGPAFLQVPDGLNSDQKWLGGIALDIHAAVPGAIAKAKAPKSAKRYIAKDGEISIAPFWLWLVPEEATFVPGDSLSVYGARWEIFGLGAGTGIGPLGFSGHLGLPSFSVSRWSGTALDSAGGARLVANYGASLKGAVTLKPSPFVHLEAGWAEQLGYQAGTVRNREGKKVDLWKQGTARFLLHIRIPLDIKI